MSLCRSGFRLDVLDEVFGPLDLPDVVVEGSGLDQHRVQADLLGRLLGQGGDDQRMMVGAGRLDGHLPEDRQVGVGELEELGLGDEPEDVLEDGQEKEGQGARSGDPAQRGPSGPRRPDRARPADLLPDEREA